MKKGQLVAIWMYDEAAKLFLGLPREHPVSRWVLVGTVMDESPIGRWVDVHRLEERRPATEGNEAKRVIWTVKPGQCLIRWDYVITAQRLKDRKPPEDPRPMPGQYL